MYDNMHDVCHVFLLTTESLYIVQLAASPPEGESNSTHLLSALEVWLGPRPR